MCHHAKGPNPVLKLIVGGAGFTAALLTASCATHTATAPAAGAQFTHAIAPKVAIATAKTISLPGIGGHGDEVVVDPAAHVAYIAQSPDNDVVVIDTAANNVKAVVPQVANANGIAFSDTRVRCRSRCGRCGGHRQTHLEGDRHRALGRKDARRRDDLLCENSIFVANDDSNNMQQFSAAAPFSVQGTLNLDPAGAKTGPDLGTYSSVDDKIYQSDDNNVDVIDAKTRTIQKVITPLSAGATAKDMYFDQAHHLLWVGTSDRDVIAIDPDSGKVVYTVKTASGMDQLAADTDHGLLFLGESKAGVMGVVDLATHQNIADVKTESGFHTEGYLPGSHLVYAYLNTSNTIQVDTVNTP